MNTTRSSLNVIRYSVPVADGFQAVEQEMEWDGESWLLSCRYRDESGRDKNSRLTVVPDRMLRIGNDDLYPDFTERDKERLGFKPFQQQEEK